MKFRKKKIVVVEFAVKKYVLRMSISLWILIVIIFNCNKEALFSKSFVQCGLKLIQLAGKNVGIFFLNYLLLCKYPCQSYKILDNIKKIDFWKI